jgi:hypothetical protein
MPAASLAGGETEMPSGVLHLSHFAGMLAFALLVSVALGCLSQQTIRGRLIYAAWSFVLFIGTALAIAWLMYPFSR